MLDAIKQREEQARRVALQEAKIADEIPNASAPIRVATTSIARPSVAHVPTEPMSVRSPEKVKSPVVVDKSKPKDPLARLETPPETRAKVDRRILKAGGGPKERPLPPDRTNPTTGDSPADDEPAQEDALAIAEARFCRRVHRFGSVEPLPEKSIRTGQKIVLYAELEGVQYDRVGEEFRSRIASKLELFRANRRGVLQSDAPTWVEKPRDTEYRCPEQLDDYFLNYLIPVPDDWEPGEYVMRLTVTDLISKRSSTSEVPLSIVRPVPVEAK